jgi:hypothetical protein
LKSINQLKFFLAVLLFPLTVSAAIFDTYLDDISDYQAAAGSLSRLYFEDFSSVNANTLITGPTNWNGFTIDLYNGGNCVFGCSQYSTNLRADISWNSSAPNVKGVYADVGPDTGLSFTPLVNTIAGMSFSFVDWNDFSQRSTFLITASDNTSTIIAGPTNGSNAPPQNFGVKLSASDIAAGRYITGIKWYGLSTTEVVGFWNFSLFTNTNLDTCEASNSSCDSIISIFSLLGLAPPGPSAADTQSSMRYQAHQLRSAFNTQTVAANFALNYDCNIFDAKGMCISAGGRYTTIDNPNINNSAAVVTLGYKVNPHIRIGGYLDQNINVSKPTGIDISNNTPLMGAYAVWNKEQSGLGYQIRLANTYQDKDVTSTRTVFDTSEAGSGKSSLTSQSYLAELSYAFQYQDKTLVRPYAGLRYTHLKQDGYTEGSVNNPLTVAALRDKGTTALLGVKINRSLTDKATLTAQLGLEQDVHHKVDNYSATNSNIGDLDSVAFNSNIKRTRPVASIGAFYDVTKTQRASATINYQQLPFQSTGSATAYFNYMIGF